MTQTDGLNRISGIDMPFLSLAGATGAGDGNIKQFPMPVNVIAMQISYTGTPDVVKALLQGSIDGTHWYTLATFDTAVAGVNGQIVASSTIPVMMVRASLVTLTGGTAPTVTVYVLANRGG